LLKRSPADLLNGLGGLVMLVWAGLIGAEIAKDQIAHWPPAPPTPAETQAARPSAEERWRLVHAGLSSRLANPTPEVGEVWATRSGRICGYVDDRVAAVDGMTRFYSVGLRPMLEHDNEALYRQVWTGCIDSRWVELHAGSEKTGFCASARGRNSVLGRILCAGWMP
jgi:hypothetical protein